MKIPLDKQKHLAAGILIGACATAATIGLSLLWNAIAAFDRDWETN